MSHPSPRQNRVDPWSRLVATPQRGQWMGNRGCLHDDQGRIIRTHQVARWIICVLDFRGRKRTLMQPGHYTELFFLDEATALAAGHRPCAECQRARYDLFRDFWAKTHHLASRPRAGEMDAVLHAARWQAGRKTTYTARLGDLPNGTIVAPLADDTPYLLWQGQVWLWNFSGYTTRALLGQISTAVRVLTPQPIVALLAAGYPVQLHPSLFESVHLELGLPLE